MQQIHVICLTKTYNLSDLDNWLKWYGKGLKVDWVHLIDNDSEANVESLFIENKYCKNLTYEKVSGWPNQYKIYEDILNHNKYSFNKNDLIMFLDDDEFIYFDEEFEDHRYKDFYDVLNQQFNQLNCAVLPQILISSKNLLKSRKGQSYIETCYYRRNEISSQCKSIIKYDPTAKYRFTKKNAKEIGHVPWINGIRMSDVHGCGVTKTTYAALDYHCPLQLYHYHIKSQEDWDIKINRGSAAVDHQWYNSDIKKNSNFGGYEVIDMNILQKFRML